MPGAGAGVPVQARGGLVADHDNPVLAALSADRFLPLPQVDVTAPQASDPRRLHSELVLHASAGQVSGSEPAHHRGVALHRPGGLALGGQVQGERPDQRLERTASSCLGCPGSRERRRSTVIVYAAPPRLRSQPGARPCGSQDPHRCGSIPMAASAFLRSRRHGRLSFGRCSHGAPDDHPPVAGRGR